MVNPRKYQAPGRDLENKVPMRIEPGSRRSVAVTTLARKLIRPRSSWENILRQKGSVFPVFPFSARTNNRDEPNKNVPVASLMYPLKKDFSPAIPLKREAN